MLGNGDIDGMAQYQDRASVTQSIARQLEGAGTSGALISCDHVPGIRLHFVFDDHALPRVEQIDTYTHFYRGAVPWGRYRELRHFVELRDGVRVVTHDVESVIDLIFALGTVALPFTVLVERLDRAVQALRSDPVRVRTIVRRIAPFGTASIVLGLLRHYREGEPVELRRVRAFRLVVLATSTAHPLHLAHRLSFRFSTRCPLGMLGELGRTFEGTSRDAVRRFSSRHQVIQLTDCNNHDRLSEQRPAGGT